MPFIISESIAILRDAGVALADILSRRADRRYEHSVLVRAPRDIVWAVASARNITLDGRPCIVIRALPQPRPGIEVQEVRTGELTCRLGLREIERREGASEIHAVVPEHSDHLALATGMTMRGFGLVDAVGGTHLTMFRDGSIGLRARIHTPMALRLMGRRIAAASEQAVAMRRPRAVANSTRARQASIR